MIIFYCSDYQISCIDKWKYAFIDGTFDAAPKEFSQVLVIMGKTNEMNIPIAYFILPNKHQESYENAFMLFMIDVNKQFTHGTVFITDYEMAEYNAVKKIFKRECDCTQIYICIFIVNFQLHVKTIHHSLRNMLSFLAFKSIILNLL